jgi:hypothetical protein
LLKTRSGFLHVGFVQEQKNLVPGAIYEELLTHCRSKNIETWSIRCPDSI